MKRITCIALLIFGLALLTADESLIIAPNGNVGINTNTPSETLDINGDVRIRGDLYSDNAIRSITDDLTIPDDLGTRIWKIYNSHATAAVTLNLTEGKSLLLQPGKMVEVTMLNGHHVILSSWEYTASKEAETIALLPPHYLLGGFYVIRPERIDGEITFSTDSGTTMDGDPTSVWSIEGEGEIECIPNGTNWSVLNYSDHGTVPDVSGNTRRTFLKTKDYMRQTGVISNNLPISISRLGAHRSSGGAFLIIYGKPFTEIPSHKMAEVRNNTAVSVEFAAASETASQGSLIFWAVTAQGDDLRTAYYEVQGPWR